MSQNELSIHESQPGEHPDKEAQFPGGFSAFLQYITENFNYSTVELIDDTRTTVHVRFDVAVNGSISNITIEKGVSQAFDDEAIRIVQNMPNWIPAENAGEKVKSSVLVPIRICLN